MENVLFLVGVLESFVFYSFGVFDYGYMVIMVFLMFFVLCFSILVIGVIGKFKWL